MGKLSRTKGNAAERTVINTLQPVLEQAYREMVLAGYAVGDPPVLQRNTLQADDGGADIAGLRWAAFEVKHHTVLALPEWWRQCVQQATRLNAEPVLIYKRTGGVWHARVMCQLNVGDGIAYDCYADIGWREFLEWFLRRSQYEAYLDMRRRTIN